MKKKQPWQMTKEELKQWEFDVPAGGGSKSPKTVLNWKRDEYETLADLAKQDDKYRFHESLGKGWNDIPHSAYLIPKIQRGDKITIYRSSDTGDIVPGSYVSESLRYVNEHGDRSIPNKKWKVYKTEVYPDELMTYGDPHEFIYIPRSVESYHKLVVDKALLEGKKVPKKVRREYEGGWAKEYINEADAIGYHKTNKMDRNKLVIDGVKLSLTDMSPKGKMVYIADLQATKKGEGRGSNTLDKLIDLSDRTGTYLMLRPEQFSTGGMSTMQLKRWYKRHGFEEWEKDWLIYKPKGKKRIKYAPSPKERLYLGAWSKGKRKKSGSTKVGRIR